jgi:PKD repeat protein
MRKLALGLLLLATSQVYSQSRIIGGNEVAIEDVPWQVALIDAEGYQFCGGSIIDSHWVLTAAHCVEGATPEEMGIAYGMELLTDDNRKELGVEAIILHSSYDPQTSENDIALIRVSNAFEFSAKAQIIPIVTKSMAEAGLTDHGDTARISGWGLMQADAWDATDTLQMVETQIVSNEEANASHRYDGAITPDMLAAGDLNDGGEDACQGDSGGPLAVYDQSDDTWKLAGVVSWGEGCADTDKPGLYARVSHFESWINARMNGGPIANFDLSAQRIFVGDTLIAMNRSSLNPTAYKWTFHGASPSASELENPRVVYSQTGFFDVELIVINSKGSDTIIKQHAIEVLALNVCDSTFNMTNNDNSGMVLEAFSTGWDDDEGYITGNNTWGPLGIFESFETTNERSISGVNISFAKAVYGDENSSVEIALFEELGAEPLISKKVKIKDIAADIINGNWTTVDFGGAIDAGTSFYAGVLLSYKPGDTVAVFAKNNTTDHALSFYGEWDGAGDWYTFEDDYGYSRSLAVEVVACKLTTDSMQNINGTIGINELSLTGVSLYPNPLKGNIINIEGLDHFDQINIFGLDGQLISNHPINSNQVIIDRSKLNNGVYFIEIKDGQKVNRQKLILN